MSYKSPHTRDFSCISKLGQCLLAVPFLAMFAAADVFAQQPDNSQGLPDALPMAAPDNALPDALPIVEADENTYFIPEAQPVESFEQDTDAQNNACTDSDCRKPANQIQLVGEENLRLPDPAYTITYIEIAGNTQTLRDRVLGIMKIQEGSRVTLGELENSRIRLALSGAFDSVQMTLKPGASPQSMGIHIDVTERLPVQVNDYRIGSSDKSPFWMGLNVTWTAPLSSLHRINFSFASASTNDYTFSLRYLVPSVAKLPLSLSGQVFSTKAHENIFGIKPHIHAPGENRFSKSDTFFQYDDLHFHRHGAAVSAAYAFNDYFRIMLSLEYSNIRREKSKDLNDTQLDTFLLPGMSHLSTISIFGMFDSRTDRFLPDGGHTAALSLRGTFRSLASNYNFIHLAAFHQSNFSVAPHHIIRLNTFAGLVYGDTPFFEKFFFNDFYTLAPSRMQSINPGNRSGYDIFNTGADTLGYEDFLVRFTVTYAWQPFSQRLELFATAGAIYADSFHHRDYTIGIKSDGKRSNFPVDMTFNAGIRFRSPYGMLSLTLTQIFDFIH